MPRNKSSTYFKERQTVHTGMSLDSRRNTMRAALAAARELRLAGQFPQAMASIEETLLKCCREDPNSKLHADILCEVGFLSSNVGKPAEAITAYTQALQMLEKLQPGTSDVAAVHCNLGVLQYEGGLYAEAVQHLAASLDIKRQQQPLLLASGAAGRGQQLVQPQKTKLQEIADETFRLGASLILAGNPTNGLEFFGDAVHLRRELDPTRLLEVTTYNDLGKIWWHAGDVSKALEARLRALALFKHIAPIAEETAELHMVVAQMHVAANALPDAAALFRDALRIYQDLPPSQRRGNANEGFCWMALGVLAEGMGQLTDAAASYEKAVDQFRRSQGSTSWPCVLAVLSQGPLLCALGELDAAWPALRDALGLLAETNALEMTQTALAASAFGLAAWHVLLFAKRLELPKDDGSNDARRQQAAQEQDVARHLLQTSRHFRLVNQTSRPRYWVAAGPLPPPPSPPPTHQQQQQPSGQAREDDRNLLEDRMARQHLRRGRFVGHPGDAEVDVRVVTTQWFRHRQQAPTPTSTHTTADAEEAQLRWDVLALQAFLEARRFSSHATGYKRALVVEAASAGPPEINTNSRKTYTKQLGHHAMQGLTGKARFAQSQQQQEQLSVPRHAQLDDNVVRILHVEEADLTYVIGGGGALLAADARQQLPSPSPNTVRDDGMPTSSGSSSSSRTRVVTIPLVPRDVVLANVASRLDLQLLALAAREGVPAAAVEAITTTTTVATALTSPAGLRRLATEVAQGLVAMLTQGLVPTDLRPDNIYIDPMGTFLVSDLNQHLLMPGTATDAGGDGGGGSAGLQPFRTPMWDFLCVDPATYAGAPVAADAVRERQRCPPPSWRSSVWSFGVFLVMLFDTVHAALAPGMAGPSLAAKLYALLKDETVAVDAGEGGAANAPAAAHLAALDSSLLEIMDNHQIAVRLSTLFAPFEGSHPIGRALHGALRVDAAQRMPPSDILAVLKGLPIGAAVPAAAAAAAAPLLEPAAAAAAAAGLPGEGPAARRTEGKKASHVDPKKVKR